MSGGQPPKKFWVDLKWCSDDVVELLTSHDKLHPEKKLTSAQPGPTLRPPPYVISSNIVCCSIQRSNQDMTNQPTPRGSMLTKKVPYASCSTIKVHQLHIQVKKNSNPPRWIYPSNFGVGRQFGLKMNFSAINWASLLIFLAIMVNCHMLIDHMMTLRF